MIHGDILEFSRSVKWKSFPFSIHYSLSKGPLWNMICIFINMSVNWGGKWSTFRKMWTVKQILHLDKNAARHLKANLYGCSRWAAVCHWTNVLVLFIRSGHLGSSEWVDGPLWLMGNVIRSGCDWQMQLDWGILGLIDLLQQCSNASRRKITHLFMKYWYWLISLPGGGWVRRRDRIQIWKFFPRLFSVLHPSYLVKHFKYKHPHTLRGCSRVREGHTYKHTHTLTHEESPFCNKCATSAICHQNRHSYRCTSCIKEEGGRVMVDQVDQKSAGSPTVARRLNESHSKTFIRDNSFPDR